MSYRLSEWFVPPIVVPAALALLVLGTLAYRYFG